MQHVKRAALAALLLAALVLSGCGASTIVHTVTVGATVQPPTASGLPLETARTPDGAQLAATPVGRALAASLQKHVSSSGLRLIENFEGWSSCPYWDSYGGVWTRGYGETEGIHAGSPCISRAFGEGNLRGRLERFYEWSLRGLGVSLNQNQWDALDSFAWNLGAGIFTGTLRYDLQHRAFGAAAQVMLQYVHAGGVVLAGLVTRRRAEVALFLKGAPASPVVPLSQLVGRRTVLRRVLAEHHCRPGKPWYGHAVPRNYHTRCGRWLREGVHVNHLIHAKGGH